MRTPTLWAAAGLSCASLLCVSTAAADERADKPIPEEKQTQLLEQFGDNGIDADGDGVLTRGEVSNFFKENPDLRPAQHEGLRGGRRGGRKGGGPGAFGRGRGGGFGRGDRPGMRPRGGLAFGILEQLERLDPEQVPDNDILERRPGLDINGDGQLSADEWAAHVENRRARLLAHLLKRAPEIDIDGDEKVSDEELQVFKAAKEAEQRARMLKRHPEADLDADGELSVEEFEAFQTQLKAERLQRLLERNPELDTDGDGVLSEEEARSLDRGRRGRRGGEKGQRRRGGRRPRPDDGPEL